MKINLANILNYEPSKQLKTMILQESLSTGLPVEEIAVRYQMAPMFIVRDNNTFWDGTKITTPEDYQKEHPYFKTVFICGPNGPLKKM